MNAAVGLAVGMMLAVATGAGVALCSLLGLQDEEGIDLVPALLLGMIALGTLLIVLSFTTPLSILGNFVLASMLTAFGIYRARVPSGGASTAQLMPYASNEALFTLGLSMVAGACWSVENLKGIRLVAPDVFESFPWQDMFFHGKNVARFIHSHGPSTLGNDRVLGRPLDVYHYASYAIPAFIGRVSGAQAYSLATSILPVLGMGWTGMAAYSLGKTCANGRVGAFAACGVLLVPDASFFGLGNSWTGYFFFQQVGVGALYAVSTLAMAASLGMHAIKTGSRRLMVGAAVLVAASALYKVQIVLVYGVPLFIFLLWNFRRHHWHASLVAIAGTLLSYAVFVSLLGRVPHAPSLSFSAAGALVNLEQIIRSFPSPLAAALSVFFPPTASYLHLVALGVPLVLVSTYGIWLVALAAAPVLMKKTNGAQRLVFFCGVLALCAHVVVALGVAPNTSGWGDPFEIIHKTFVWPYYLVVVSCCIVIGSWLGDEPPITWGRQVRAGFALAIVFATGLVATIGPTVQASLIFSATAMRLKLSRSLYEAADYLRTRSAPNSIVQYSENDPYLMLSSLSERDSYVIQCVVNCPPDPETARRFAILRSILELPDIAEVRANARKLGIDWLVVKGGSRSWQSAPGANPETTFGDLYLYSTRATGG
ncbi:MAG: hypothetical protein ACXWJM_09850 [Ramlibacter sp.]